MSKPETEALSKWLAEGGANPLLEHYQSATKSITVRLIVDVFCAGYNRGLVDGIDRGEEIRKEVNQGGE